MRECAGGADVHPMLGGGGSFDAGVFTPPDGGPTADGSSADGSVVIDCPTPTAGPTVHSGDVKGAETPEVTGSEPSGASLIAVGTAAKPIVFTSASPTPAARDWVGLWYGGALDPSRCRVRRSRGTSSFRPTNTFTNVAGCVQTLPKVKAPQTCGMPLPACDGM